MSSVWELYSELNFNVVSGTMNYVENKNGEWKKDMRFDCLWLKGQRTCNKERNGFALVTGKESGVTVIDIDNPERQESQTLMDLMTNCNMVARTRKGYHYAFAYCDKIKTTTSKQHEIDTRNDGGCLYCEPTRYTTNTGEIVEYKWIKTPFDMGDHDLEPLSEEALEYLQQLNPKYFKASEVPEIVSVQEKKNAEPPAPKGDALEAPTLLHRLASFITNNDNYDDWLNNGMICYNEGLPMKVWADMSRKVAKYASTPDSDYTSKWDTFKNYNGKKLTQATWWKWLKTNNMPAWSELMLERDDFLNKCININHRDFAQLFYNMHPHAYVWNASLNWYSIQPNNTWKHFDKGCPHGLKNHIAQVLQEQVMDTRKAIIDSTARARAKLRADQKDEEEALKEQEKKNLTTLTACYKQFGNTHFISGIIDFLPSFYEVSDLTEKMDTLRGVFAFTDCLVELETGKVRAIQPNDWISRTCEYAYPKQSNAETRRKILAFLNNIFAEADTPAFVQNVFASCLLGKNRFERFYVLTGVGGNGKGVLMTLVHSAFGGYAMTADTSLICKPQERRDQPCPALVDARDRLLMSFTEPEREDKIQVGIIKKMTGGDDRVEARTLNSKTIVSYIPKFIPIVQANNIPKLSKIDGGVKRRMVVIDFPFEFVASPDPENAKQKQGDPDVKDRLCKSEEWRNEFILMLIESAKTVAVMKTLAEPSSVQEATNDYLDDNNGIKEWLTCNYVITKNPSDKIKASEFLEQYNKDTKGSLTPVAFADLMKYNGVERKKCKDAYYYTGIKKAPEPKCAIVDE